MNIHEFIEEFRSVIVASVGRDSNPLYHPGTDRKKIYELIKSLRRPIAARSTSAASCGRSDFAIQRFWLEKWAWEDLYLHRRRSAL
jgi:hypothetical protein